MPLGRKKYVTCLSPSGLHRMVYTEWGDENNDRVLLCVHGLTRSSLDFIHLANALKDRYRVIAPDIVGRGSSDWLKNPSYYTIPQYVQDIVTLLARVNATHLHWVGTSMGGIIGMVLAGIEGSPIQKLILNDVGPRLSVEGLMRIAEYIKDSENSIFRSFSDARAFVEQRFKAFGVHAPKHWADLTSAYVKEDENGLWRLHYDPAIAMVFHKLSQDAIEAGEQALWTSYDAIRSPTLLLRGESSDLLSADTAKEMHQRGPRARLVTIPEVGHAPTLMSSAQIEIVREFLLH